MPLFKTREERRIEREIEVRKGINAIRANIRDLERNEKEYLAKAKRAKQWDPAVSPSSCARR